MLPCSNVAMLITHLPTPPPALFFGSRKFYDTQNVCSLSSETILQTNKIIYNCQTILTISISIYAWPDISGKYAGQNAAAAASVASHETLPIKYAHNNGACSSSRLLQQFLAITKGQSNECPKLLNFYLKRTTTTESSKQKIVVYCRGVGVWALDNARTGLQLPTATNHFDRVQSIQMPRRTLLYAKAKRFFSFLQCFAQEKFYKQNKACTHCIHARTTTHSGANCTMGTVARTETATTATERAEKLCERATACKTALSVVVVAATSIQLQ